MKMKKGLLTMLALLSMGSSVFAQMVNVPTVVRKAGEVKEVSVVANRQGTVKIELQGGANYRDLQFDITLPDGITLADETNGGSVAIETDHAVGFATQTATGAVRFVLYSETGAKLSDAILLEIPVTVANTFTGTQPATLTNVLTSNDEATTSIAIADGNFNFRACLLGDVNDNGEVNLTDAVNILYATPQFNSRPDLFVEEVADVNGDTKLSLPDAVGALYIGWGVDPSTSAKKYVVEDELESVLDPE